MSAHRKKLLLLTLLAALLSITLAACGGNKNAVPTVAPEVIITPTAGPAAPIEQEEDVWARIQKKGVMVVGTSADYPPFEYYNQTFKIDGFDIALINEVAKKLGVKARIVDIAFDGLGDALALGQIDVGIAAISITPEREASVDFSQVYFVSEDAFIAKKGSNPPPINAVKDLATLRVGVQKGSIFQNWLEDQLVATGLMPETNLFVYGDIKQAYVDLKDGRVDVIVMDKPAAELALSQGNFEIAASGLHRELYGIAMAKGQQNLRTKVNQALTDMLRTHAVDKLAKDYLGLDSGDIAPVPTPTPIPPQPLPTPTPPQGCYDGMAYVSDLNYDDQNMQNPPTLNPGEVFRKGWRMKNTGTCTWDSRYVLDFISGNMDGARMGGQPTAVRSQVAPGQTYDIYVDLVAPLAPGAYQGFWQMHDGDNQAFGQRVYVGIRVPNQATPTPFPTATPSADVNFWTDNVNLTQGQCTVNHWRTQNIKEIYYYHDGQSWQNHGVAGTGDVQTCPSQSITYYLRVVHRDGSVDQRAIRINVTPSVDAPQINYFAIDPPGQIALGQCVNLRWEVAGNVSQVSIYSNDRTLWQQAPFRGALQDCPGSAGQYNYRLQATGPGGVSQANLLIIVNNQPTPTPAPTQVPQPIIYNFSVLPTTITAGMCVTIGWNAGGAASTVRVLRNGQIILDGVGLQGSQQDCLANPGQYAYELQASNPQGQTATAQVTVQVDGAQPTQAPPPQIAYLAITSDGKTPVDSIKLGDCVYVTYDFSGDSLAATTLFRNEQPVSHDLTAPGSYYDCITDMNMTRNGLVIYKLKVDSEFGGSAVREAQLMVASPK